MNFFVHRVGHSFALSFLSKQDLAGKVMPSLAVIGWSPKEEASVATFTENKEFVDVMHTALRLNFIRDPQLISWAKNRKEGWMHIEDERNPPPFGRIPDPDDIIASVKVEEGRLTGAYEPNNVHRMFSTHGMFRVSPFLSEQLLKTLKRSVIQ